MPERNDNDWSCDHLNTMFGSSICNPLARLFMTILLAKNPASTLPLLSLASQ